MSTEARGLPARLASFLDELRSVEDPDLRGELLIETASRFTPVPEHVATRPFKEEHRAPACMSEAFVWVEPAPDGTVRVHCAVENPHGISAKALAVILSEALSGARPEELLGIPEEIVYDIFGRELSMGKGQGLMGMITLVKALARRAVNRSA